MIKTKEKKIFGRTYKVAIDGGRIQFFINGSDGSEYRRNSFYKYYALNELSVNALTHLYLYATHPCQFNDPFDCAEELINFDDMECIRVFLEELYPRFAEICNNEKEALTYLTNNAYRTYLYMKWGILCLSRMWDDLSMWSSYSDHKGFCLELDLSHFPYKITGPFPINYQKELRSLSINDISIQLATLIQTNVKLECWQHEKEWRLLIECPDEFYMEPMGEYATKMKQTFPDYHDRKFKYPIKCLKSVCLGMKFFNGVYSVITNYENEFIVDNEHQNNVLSFLALTKIPTYVLMNTGLAIEKRLIEIIKVQNNIYRIIY